MAKFSCIIVGLFIQFLGGIESCSVKPSLTPSPTISSKLGRFQATPSSVAAVPGEDHSRFGKYAKYAKSGFFLEIEETVDNQTRVYQIKKLPPIYSQTMRRSADGQDGNHPESNIQQVLGPEDANGGGDVSLTEEDAAVQKDWGGECEFRHWRHCNSLQHITVMDVYNKTTGRTYETMHMEMDCKLQNIVCMKNGWTVNKCQIICMSKCSKDMLQGYDSFVNYAGPCKYI